MTSQEPPMTDKHAWIKSTVGHGESMCRRCGITNREAAALSSTQARADKLEEELASAQQSNENWMNRCLTAETKAESHRQAHESLAVANRRLSAELVEAKRQRDWLASEKEQAIRLKEAAESALAAANERMALVQRCIGARMDRMTPGQRECAVNAAWWLLNDMTGIRPASEKPEFVNREIAELVKDCADALKTAGKE